MDVWNGNRILGKKVKKETKTKFYKMIAALVLLYGIETQRLDDMRNKTKRNELPNVHSMMDKILA